jgi:hypothetical protein
VTHICSGVIDDDLNVYPTQPYWRNTNTKITIDDTGLGEMLLFHDIEVGLKLLCFYSFSLTV